MIDCFRRYYLVIPFKTGTARVKERNFQILFQRSNRKPSLLITDDEKDYFSKSFSELLNIIDRNKKSIRHNFRETVFAKKIYRTILEFSNEPAFEIKVQLGLRKYQKYLRKILIKIIVQQEINLNKHQKKTNAIEVKKTHTKGTRKTQILK